MRKMFAVWMSMAAAVVLMGASAQAQVGPGWTCQLSGNMSGTSASLIISVEKLEGTGWLTCSSADSRVERIPVRMSLFGLGLGIGFSQIENVTVYSAQLGLLESPESMIGRYSVGVSAGGTLVNMGGSFDLAISVAKEGGFGFEIGMVGKDVQGLEAKLQGRVFEISRL